MPGKILTIAIHKGGTGKTTTAVCLSRFAQEQGIKTCLIDADAQKNATKNFIATIDPETLSTSVLFESEPDGNILGITDNLDLIVSDDKLFSVERFPLQSAIVFKKSLKKLARKYDLVIIDTPPTMGFGMLAPLFGSDYALSPIIPDAYSIEGIQGLIKKIKQIQQSENPDLKFLGLFINKWRRDNQAHNKTVKLLNEKIPNQLISQSLGDYVAIDYAARQRIAVWHNVRSGAHRNASNRVKSAMTVILKKMDFMGGTNG